VYDEEQPPRSQLEKLSKYRVKQLILRGLIDPHDGYSKLGRSRQDYWMDKDTGELYVGRKHGSIYFERLGINVRDEDVSGF
jgi:hypothetical protein